ncbi:hypothetical protein L1049_008022 [Liquidambar formosana]|uniref:SHSP domain-containing protein n=1 Tax=Liquidambar formosana TaxID=63359 RepID=A0AAP0S970_LIQFO
MACATKAGATVPHSYADFEPFCIWKREEECDTLIIDLQEFRKDQLKVQIDNQGTLTVTGERQKDGTSWSRFCRQIKIPKECKANEICAKFICGRLHILMPKKVVVPVEKELWTTGECVPCCGSKAAKWMSKINKTMVVNVVLAIAVGVALGAYAECKYRPLITH